MIAHHATTLRIAVEIAIVVALAASCAAIWLWGRRRPTRRPAPMRDDRPDVSD